MRPKPSKPASGTRRSIGGAIVVAMLAAACTTANPVMTFLFDGVPAPGEERAPQAVVKPPRRPPYKPPPSAVTWVAVPDQPPAIDWKARYAELPRTDGGDVAWVKALEDKLVAPKP